MSKAQELRENVARAIWNVMREYEDRCDMELEDIGEKHHVWDIAEAAIAASSEQQAAQQDATLVKPEAGRYVLAWMEGYEVPIRAMWVPSKFLEADDECSADWADYDEAKDRYFCKEGWYEHNAHEDTHWGVTTPVVAWMELPRLSARASNGGKAND